VTSPSPHPGHGEAAAWHAESPEAVRARLEVGDEGLSAAQAAERLEAYGPNVLPRVGGPSAWRLLVRQVASPLMYALLASAGIAIALGEVEDGLVVLAVVVLNALIGFVQEYRAGRAIAALADLVAEPATVRRDGRWLQVRAEQVVPGDLVALAPGDRVPADVRLVRGEALRTEEAPLTGESTPVSKTVAAVPDATPLAERRSVAFAGTTVAAGSGEGVAVSSRRSTSSPRR
jgi:magnesium-transporting ATPase (P-type)